MDLILSPESVTPDVCLNQDRQSGENTVNYFVHNYNL